MANYPNWVMKFKRKGTYVNVVKGRHYLYAVHSERVFSANKVNRICDEYLSRITEIDGFIPPEDKVKENIILF